MLYFITQIISVVPCKIACRFNTGEIRSIDLGGIIEKYGNVADSPFAALKEPAFFKQVTLDSYGTLSWPNGIDFCPDVLYHMSISAQDSLVESIQRS